MCCLTEEQMLLEEAATKPLSILIIDDDESQSEALSICLERQGYRTITAHNGKEGLSKAEQLRPELVLLDIGLPDSSGIDICDAIDLSPQTSGTPVILLSGQDGADVVRRSRAAGARFFLRKPFDPNVLLLLVEQEFGMNQKNVWLG